MTIIQEFEKKKKEKNKVLKSARKLSDGRHDIIDIFEKEIFPNKDDKCIIKQKKEELEENKSEKIKDDYKNLSNLLRMNQRKLTMICSKNILIL